MARKKIWPPRVYAHKGSGTERVRIDGKDIQLGPIGSDRAKQKYAEIIAKFAGFNSTADSNATASPQTKINPVSSKKKNLTIAELVARWHVYASERYDPKGKEADQFRYSLAPLVEHHGTEDVGTFGLAQLDDVREKMIALRWSRKVINRRVTRVRTVWRWAERKGLVPPGSWSALQALGPLEQNDHRVKKGNKPREARDYSELERVLARSRSETVKAILLVLWHTGARPSEIRLLKVGEIEQPSPSVENAIWTAKLASHKNAWRGHDRTLVFGPKAQEAIKPFLEGKAPGDLVFPSSPAKSLTTPYSDETLSRAIARAAARAGVKDFTAYSCRHSAKARVAREMGLEAARMMLGHSSIDTTASYARGIDAQTAEDVARRLG